MPKTSKKHLPTFPPVPLKPNPFAQVPGKKVAPTKPPVPARPVKPRETNDDLSVEIPIGKGRPKATASARLACEALVPEAIKALKAALKRPGERMEAAKTVLAYAYGKPQSTSNIRMIHSIQDLSEEELRTIAGDAVDEIPLLSNRQDDSSC